MDKENKPGVSADDESVKPSAEKGSDPKQGPRISYIVSGICALAVAAAAGAAVVADKAFKEESGARIYNSSSYTADNSSSAAESDSSGSRDDSSSSRRTKVTTTAKVYEYPQDINEAELDCFLAVSGINKTAAEGLIAYRERNGAIHNYEELLDIYGIGERSLTVIREHFFISEDKQIAYTTTEKTTRARKSSEKSTTTRKAVSAVTEFTSVTETETRTEAAADSFAEEEDGMKTVNINTAGAEEIADSLKLSPELATEIVRLRSRIGRYNNMLELLYIEGMTKQVFNERAGYILLDEPQAED